MDWIKKVREQFPREDSIYIVKDEDNILESELVTEVLNKSNRIIVDYDNPIHFRYHYENEYRFTRKGTLIIRLKNKKFTDVPFDIYSIAFKLSIDLNLFINNLDIKAIKDSKALLSESIELDQQQSSLLNYYETKELLSRLKENKFHPKTLSLEIDRDNFTSYGNLAYNIGVLRSKNPSITNLQKKMIEEGNRKFQGWLLNEFDSTVTLPPYPYPKFVHQILDFMNYSEYTQKKALIVLDGMSFAQWAIIEEYLNNESFILSCRPVLAWIPSITSVSRQSIFSGKPPYQFPNTIDTTNYESVWWQKYWTSQGYSKEDIFYQRSLGSSPYSSTDLSLTLPHKKIIGCVIDVIDKFIHSATQGIWSVSSELNYWLTRGFLKNLLLDLLNNDYEVYITSDHGNIESTGIGKINQGILAHSRGQRVRIYDMKDIRNRTNLQFLDTTIAWDSNYLPKDFYPLVAKDDFSFVSKGDKIMSHGGTHLEEVFVPLVKVSR